MFKALLQKEACLILRDVYALLVLFLMPVVFVVIMSMSLQEVFSDKQATDAKNSSASASGGLKIFAVFDDKISQAWQNDFLNLESFDVLPIENSPQAIADARQATLSGERLALIQVPTDLVKKLKRGEPIQTPIQIDYSPVAPSYARSLLKAALMRKLVEKKIAVTFAAGSRSASRQQEVPELDIRKFLGPTVLSEDNLSYGTTQVTPTSVQQSVPAWLVFAMFFIVIPFSATLLVELNNGTLERLNTFPIAKQWILLGKLLPYMLINLLQTGLMFLTGVFLVPLLGGEALQLSSNAWLLLPVSLALSLTAISFALLIAVWVKTHEQASTVGGVSNLLMGAMGGVMVPVFVMPDAMQKLAAFSPMNWGLEAFLEILLRQGDFQSVWPYILQLLGLALVLFLAAYWRLQKRLTQPDH
ncbi:ABC transporter permease [Hydrogenovibrio thermophilus]|uniref:ABC transmembrane type-2 domain-containing protein n=1 Tax=Hydrogenovibrio thermophilus TaxID=265883 RepID=A0A451G415_9GAMM|nr:ABC transporter permease [Hydrogenovibrio thermophilus]QAB14196.1 hypothetical protein EPV75_00160 [Hydrogenovibrio thermophilus]